MHTQLLLLRCKLQRRTLKRLLALLVTGDQPDDLRDTFPCRLPLCLMSFERSGHRLGLREKSFVAEGHTLRVELCLIALKLFALPLEHDSLLLRCGGGGAQRAFAI